MIDKQKKEIRNRIQKEKKNFTLEQKKEKSEIIFKKLESLNEFKNSKVIMVYWSMSDEVFTHDFIQKFYKTKKIILPVVDGENLILKEFTGVSNMTEGVSYGIMEPAGETFTEIEKIDLIITPGVAFDKSGNRLGRGKAYYDKLLKSTNAFKVGVCFNFQFLDWVPTDIHDIKMDLVLSD